MTALIIRFPCAPQIESGLTYVVACDDGCGSSSWTLYRQPEGEDEPKFIQDFHDFDEAVKQGREQARLHRDRFVIDEGPLG